MNSRLRKKIFLIAVPLAALSAILYFTRATAPPVTMGYEVSACKQIKTMKVGPGPEDMALDDSGENPRIFISIGELEIINPEKRKRTGIAVFEPALDKDEAGKMDIVDKPGDFDFKPHGLHLWKTPPGEKSPGETYLYVISHGRTPEKCEADKNAKTERKTHKKHSVLKFLVRGNTLVYKKCFSTSRFKGDPNDLFVTGEDEFYITDPIRKFMAFFPPASVWLHRKDGRWFEATNSVSYPNGILIRGNKAFVASTGDNQIHVFTRKPDGVFEKKKGFISLIRTEDGKIIKNLMLLDNFTFLGKEKKSILIATHPSKLKFGLHAMSPANISSPSVVLKINLNDWLKNGKAGKKHAVVFSVSGPDVDKPDERIAIQAASAALYYKGRLYISQVFEGYILSCKAGKKLIEDAKTE